jgi:hypothetical protein
MTTCRFDTILLSSGALAFVSSPALAGHAGEMESPGLMPHELLIGLVGLAGVVLFALLALTWVVWRVRGLERRLRDLEGGRKT